MLEWLRHVSRVQWFCIVVVVLWGLRVWNACNSVRALEAFDDAYRRWLANDKSVTDKSLTEMVPRAVRLMAAAGQSVGHMPHAECVGYGQIATRQLNVLDQLPSCPAALVVRYQNAHARAVGVYKERIGENFSLRFWLSFAVFLPRHALECVGVRPDATAVKVLNVVHWIGGAAVPVLEHYRNAVLHAITEALRQSP